MGRLTWRGRAAGSSEGALREAGWAATRSQSQKSQNRSVAHPPPIWWGLGHPAESGLLRMAPCGCPDGERARAAPGILEASAQLSARSAGERGLVADRAGGVGSLPLSRCATAPPRGEHLDRTARALRVAATYAEWAAATSLSQKSRFGGMPGPRPDRRHPGDGAILGLLRQAPRAAPTRRGGAAAVD